MHTAPKAPVNSSNAPLSLKWKLAIGGFMLVFWIAAAGYIHLESKLLHYPRQPDPNMGRTVPFETRNIVVFVDERERSMVSWLQWTAVSSGVVGFGLSYLSSRKPGKSQ